MILLYHKISQQDAYFPSSKHIELLGTISPKPCPVKSKYNKAGAIKKTLFEAHDIPEGMASLMAETANMALAQNTKSNYKKQHRALFSCSTERHEFPLGYK